MTTTFVRVVLLVNAGAWAWSAIGQTSPLPGQSHWIEIALFALSLIGAVVPIRPKRPAETGQDGAQTRQPKPPPQDVTLPQDMTKYRTLVAQGKKIQAIKALREECPHLGLKDAKDVVESL